MLLGIILAAVFLVLCLLLSMKTGVRIVFGDATRIWLKIGPMMLQVYPMPEKRTKKPPQKAEKELSSQKEPSKRKVTFDAVWTLVQELLPPLLDTMERIRRGICVKTLCLNVVVSDANPALAAQRYGKLHALVWPLLAALEQTVCVKQRDVQLHLDFASRQTSVQGEVMLTMRVFRALHIGVKEGGRILRPVLHFLKATEAAGKAAECEKETNPKEPAAA